MQRGTKGARKAVVVVLNRELCTRQEGKQGLEEVAGEEVGSEDLMRSEGSRRGEEGRCCVREETACSGGAGPGDDDL